jgi:nitroreductase
MGMDFFEVVRRRHSYRGPFREDAVPREDLERIVQAGLHAPSGKNEQTTTFVIVDDAELVGRIAALPGANQAVREARAYIACTIGREPAMVYEGYHFHVEDCAAATENMLLAITALGYASVWVDGWVRLENRAATIGDWLNVPADRVIRILLPIGVPAEEHSQREKLPFAKRAWFNQYGE